MKKLLCLFLCMVFLMSICGCGSSAEVETVYEEVTQGETQTTPDTTQSSIPGDTTSSQPTDYSQPDLPSTPDTSKPVDTDVQAPPSTPEGEGIYKLSDQSVLSKIKLNGRCEKATYGIGLGLAGSAIELNTNGSAVMLEANCTEGIYYTIMVDGVVTYERQITESGTNYINLARNLSAGTHNIRIIRDCEGRTDMRFNAISLQIEDGELLAKDGDKEIIEFLGDSLTSGYGNLVADGAANPSDLKNQSAMKAYPYLVANKLGYDYRIVSQSGIALRQREGYFAFSDYYKLENYHLDRTKEYTSSSPQDVDVVVVNLGTNDIGAQMYDTKNIETVRAYEKYYADLITNIGYSMDVKIIFVTGVWYDDPAIIDGGVVNELKARGYDNVYTLEFNTYKSGGGAHPSGKEHAEMADLMVKFLKNNDIV